jgi:hypothetical protein
MASATTCCVSVTRIVAQGRSLGWGAERLKPDAIIAAPLRWRNNRCTVAGNGCQLAAIRDAEVADTQGVELCVQKQ